VGPRAAWFNERSASLVRREKQLGKGIGPNPHKEDALQWFLTSGGWIAIWIFGVSSKRGSRASRFPGLATHKAESQPSPIKSFRTAGSDGEPRAGAE
jgi:hypothetical protein